MKVFQYALIRRSKEKKPELLKGKSGFLITTVLADDLDKAKLLAARDIPDELPLDEIELAVRPF